MEPDTPASVVCVGDVPSLVDGLQPVTPVDYLALYEGDDNGGNAPPVLKVVQQNGSPCSSATKQDACKAALASATSTIPTPSFELAGQLPIQSFYVYTRNDDVGTIGSKEQLLQFLGKIDTANEAAALLWPAQRPVQCGDIFEDARGYHAASSYMVHDCPITTQVVEVLITPAGDVSETKMGEPVTTQACVGRRPSGLHCAGLAEESPEIGAYFAEIAQLELAAVAAFELLERELEAHGAPERLLELCRKARADELRHTAAMTELALKFGALPAPIRVAPQNRTLLELALENAREGTVRELYGAAVAALQAQQAESTEVRRVFERIAKEEAEHAWLSCELDAWLMTELTVDERALVEAERVRAYAELARELEQPVADALSHAAGVPQPAQALALLESLRGELMAA
jgi:bacterioferritin (cytochrome b1)